MLITEIHVSFFAIYENIQKKIYINRMHKTAAKTIAFHYGFDALALNYE